MAFLIAAAAAAYAESRASVSEFSSWLRDQWLSRKLPGIWHQAGTVEASSLVDCVTE